LGVGVTTSPRKQKNLRSGNFRDASDEFSKKTTTWLKENKLIFGTWNVRTLLKTGALLSLLSQLKEYRLALTALQETR